MRAAVFDRVEIELGRMAFAAKGDRDAARVGRPLGAIGVRAGIEIVVGADAVERHDLAMRRLRRQPDVEIAIAEHPFSMGRQRYRPIGRKPPRIMAYSFLPYA